MARRPWKWQEALLWWGMALLSLGVVAWSGLEGWVWNRHIERVHAAGTVVSTRLQDHTVMVLTEVTTDRVTLPLLGKVTLVAGAPMTLQ
jgi:hypothetical protein